MIRIQVSTSPTGAETPGVHWTYNFSVNPTDVEFQDSQDISQNETLHGSPVFQKSTWDGRVRQLLWTGGWGATTTVLPSISKQVASCRAWIGSIRYFNFKDLDKINNNWPVNNTWKKVRVIDLKTKMKVGSEFRYESVILEIVPEI